MNLPENFRSIVGIVLNNWTALKLSISHGYGGPPIECNAKIQDLINMIDEGFSSNGFEDWGDLCDLLSDYMDQVFHTLIEDSSDEELGTKLSELYLQWSSGRHHELLNYLASLPIKVSIERALPEITSQPAYHDSNDSDDNDNNDDDTSGSKNQAGSGGAIYEGSSSNSAENGSSSSFDTDGWQVYHNRRHRGDMVSAEVCESGYFFILGPMGAGKGFQRQAFERLYLLNKNTSHLTLFLNCRSLKDL